MEIAEICRLSDFEEASLNCLDAPSLLSRIFSFSGIQMLPHAPSLWKWGALLLAVVAAFRTLANGVIRVLFLTLRNPEPLNALQPLLEEEDGYFSSSEGEDETCSLPSSGEDDDGDYDDESSSSFPFDFRVAGSDQGYDRNLTIRRRRGGCGDRFSWSDFANGTSVVKLWDGLGLGLDVEKYTSGGPISLWDLNHGDCEASSAGTFLGGCSEIPAFSVDSSAVVVSAAAGETRSLALSVWDKRISRRNPVIYNEWRPEQGKEARVDCGGFRGVYVGDALTGELTVGDLRKTRSPLGRITESGRGGDTWWDSDAVVVPNESVEECGGASCCDSVARRCRDAVRFYLF